MSRTATYSPANGGSLFQNRNFVLLWCAYGVSAMGDHLSEMALLKTQDALNPGVDITPLTARISFMFFIPFFVLAPVAGVLADRWSRRALMVTADVVRCAIMMMFAALIGWAEGLGSWGAFAPLLLVGTFAAVFSPARSALLPTLIRSDQLVRANAMLSGLGIIATMAAAKVGGILADHYEPIIAFRADAATFIASAVLLLLMRPPRSISQPEGPVRRQPPLENLRKGFAYARSHRHVLELLAVAALVWFCGAFVNSVIPAVVRDVYHGTYGAISDYRALLGLGFILGAITMTVLGEALRSEVAMSWGLFGISLGIAIFAESVFITARPGTLAAIGAVGIVIAGASAVSVMASFNALLQRTVADRFRGRIFGVKDVGCTGALLVATGWLAFPLGTRIDRWVGWILVGVAVVIYCAACMALVVRLRRGVQGPLMTTAEHVNEFLAKFWWRFRRVGPSTVPRTGPVIITSNHRCPADPVFLSAAVPYRPISFMIAAEYANWPVVSWIVRLIECIPVRRGTRDPGATKQAMRHLRAGKAMGIFIEGGIVAPGAAPEPKDGVAMLALKTGAMVIPAFISGTIHREGIVRGLLTRHRARVRFGKPVDLTEFRIARQGRDNVRAATRKIYAAVNALAPGCEDSPAAREKTEQHRRQSE